MHSGTHVVRVCVCASVRPCVCKVQLGKVRKKEEKERERDKGSKGRENLEHICSVSLRAIWKWIWLAGSIFNSKQPMVRR